MGYREGKLERRKSLVEGEREKKKRKMEVQGLCASVFLSLNPVPYMLCVFGMKFILQNLKNIFKTSLKSSWRVFFKD